MLRHSRNNIVFSGVMAVLLTGIGLAYAAVTITGDVEPDPASTDTSSSALYVGDAADGTLTIDGGSTVSAAIEYIGYTAGVTGVVTVDGASSTNSIRQGIDVGEYGVGTLNITNGASSAIKGEVTIGDWAGSSGTVMVSGPGSTMSSGGAFLTIGAKGLGTLDINSGGSVSDVNATIGNLGSSGQVTVDGAGSVWTNSGDIILGSGNATVGFGQGTLAITDGGVVSASEVDADNGTISFNNGTLNADTLDVGSDQLAGTGTINTHGIIGDFDLVFDQTRGLDQTVIFSNQPRQNISLNLSADGGHELGVGNEGSGALTIQGGVTVSSSIAELGLRVGSSGTATVDGVGSAWVTSGLGVGIEGNGSLSITNGGRVETSNSNVAVGAYGTSTGQVSVTGVNSSWTVNNARLSIGVYGGGSLTISDGGSVDVAGGSFGAGSFIVGYATGGTVNVTTGGQLSDLGADIGGEEWYSQGAVTVEGFGSTWSNSGEVILGNIGAGVLTISDQGRVVIGGGLHLADGSNSSGTVNLSGGTLDLQCTAVTRGSGIATFNFTAGTLENVSAFDMNLHQQGGALEPGSGYVPGYMTINGNYTLDQTATLQMSIAGEYSSQYDQIAVVGDFANNGLLEIVLLNNFQPDPGSEFDLIHAASMDGTFSGGFLPSLRPYLEWVTGQLDTTGTLYVTYPGDANLDGVVNAKDLAMITPGGSGWSQGDFNGDGVVNQDDWSLFAFGLSVQGTYPVAATPEPEAIAMIALAGLAFIGRRRRSLAPFRPCATKFDAVLKSFLRQ